MAGLVNCSFVTPSVRFTCSWSARFTCPMTLATVLAEPPIRERLLAQGADAVGGTPEALGRVVAAELPKWAKLAKDANIKAD